jgi:hypothetical protein
MKAIRERLNNAPRTAEDDLLTLEDLGLSRTVERLREHIDLI